MSNFLAKNWFLIGLVAVLALGSTAADLLKPLAEFPGIRYAVVFGVLFCMALPLEATTLWRVIRRPAPALLASLVNMGLIPPAAWLLTGLLPASLAGGLVVASAPPCTIASAAVWTRKAGGNDAVAIMVTVLTNMSCFVITPAWVLFLLKSDIPSISLGGMTLTLFLIVLVPMALAQIARLHPAIAPRATKHKQSLGIVAQLGILTMVLIGTVKMQSYLTSDASTEQTWSALTVMVVLVVAIHVAALFGGLYLSRLARMKRPEQLAVAFAGSQKTLLVGLSVSIELNVSILPMIAYHVSQLMIDTAVAGALKRDRRDRLEA